MADNPPAALLIDQVRAALEGGLASGFPQKVAANALGIAQRELASPPPVTPERAAALSSAIRDGAIDDQLVGELIAIAVAKVAIDQPGYPAYRAWSEEG